MYGYISANINELTIAEKKTYQAYYCGLCTCLRKEYGIAGRMMLKRDLTFYILLAAGLYNLRHRTSEFICPVHPGKKKIAFVNDATKYTAAMDILLSYYSVQDRWNEDHSYPSRVMIRMIRNAYRRVSEEYPRQAKAVSLYVNRIQEYELNGVKNGELYAGATGDMLGELFIWKNDEFSDELHTMGYYLGKFVYFMDAYEDLEEDREKRAFNPFEEIVSKDPDGADTVCRLMLTSLITECVRASERLPEGHYSNLIRNILYSGIWCRYDELQKQRTRQTKKDGKRLIRERRKQEREEALEIRREEAAIRERTRRVAGRTSSILHPAASAVRRAATRGAAKRKINIDETSEL